MTIDNTVVALTMTMAASTHSTSAAIRPRVTSITRIICDFAVERSTNPACLPSRSLGFGAAQMQFADQGRARRLPVSKC
jgi:hypothetical protein